MKTPDQYLQIVKKHFPSIDDNHIKTYTDGWDHLVIVVNNETVFRFPKKGNMLVEYKRTFNTEALLLQKLSLRVVIQIPQITVFEDGEDIYEVYRFIPGRRFSRELAAMLSDGDLKIIGAQLGEFLNNIHTFSIDEAVVCGISEKSDIKNLDYWKGRHESVLEVLKSYFTQDEYHWVDNLFIKFYKVLTQSSYNSTLCHGDVMPEHILIDEVENKIKGIIDFTDAVISDPAYDFAFLGIYGKEFLSDVYKAYTLPRDEHFEDRRIFYERNFALSNLHHAVSIHEVRNVHQLQKELQEYIRNNPL